MIFYFLSFLIPFASIFIKQSRKPVWFKTYIVLLCLFLCFGYMTGTDWRVYEKMYYKIDFNNLFYDYYQEPGYYIYMLPFRYFDIDFFVYFIFTKVICFALLFNNIIYYCKEYKYLSIGYFVPCWAFYLFIDNPMRNLIAASICVCSIKYIIERKFVPFLIITLLGISFHATAAIMLPAYFILSKTLDTKKVVITYIIINVLFASKTIFVYLLSKIFGFIPYVEGKINSYLELSNIEGGGRAISLGSIIFLVFFILICYYKDHICQKPNGKIIWNGAIAYLFLYRFATTVEVFMRFQTYFVVFFIAAIAFLIDVFTNRSKPLYVAYLLVLALIGSSTIFSTWRYLPYTNYLTYMVKGEFPAYSYRSAYNPNNSPYKAMNKESKN